MTFSLLTKLSIAAAATMLTFSPALAHSPGKHHHGHGYHSHGHGHGAYYNYKKRKHARHFHGQRHYGHHANRYWKPRFNSWKYANRAYRNW